MRKFSVGVIPVTLYSKAACQKHFMLKKNIQMPLNNKII